MGKSRTFFFDGLGVSSGVAIGPAHVVDHGGATVDHYLIGASETEAEIERFQAGVAAARLEIEELGRAVTKHLDAQQASIFDAHVQLLEDPLLIERTIAGIRDDHRNAEFVFWSVTQEIGDRLKQLDDAYFSERSHDLYDVARRVIKFLRDSKNPEGESIPPGSIVVAAELGPSETAHFHRSHIAAFVTDSGGPTSHMAIMAKALSLPAVVGLDFVTHYVRTGDRLIVDGTAGKVILNPTKEQVQFYEERYEELLRARERLSQISDLPAVTLDGVRVALEANVEFTNELELIVKLGAEGIGLYRTEYFFIDRRTLPTEEEQEVAYRQVLQAMDDRPVVFRTLDVGGDKMAGSIPTPPESNPFLGLRALRLCLAYPDLFRCQIRPMIRAAAGRVLRILLPMISGAEEIQQARRLIEEVYESLEASGHPMPKSILIGAMIEIPSAAIQAEVLAREVDFFSIGTNDLVQYTLAVDRVNKLVGHLYHDTHPAVLRLIAQVVEAGRRHDKPVAVCGEMAGNPPTALLLAGLGIRTLSMSPTLIGPVKKALRSVEMARLENLAARLLHLPTATQVREELEDFYSALSLDSSTPAF